MTSESGSHFATRGSSRCARPSRWASPPSRRTRCGRRITYGRRHGIMTVTGMSSIVAGLNASMARQIEGLGSSVVFIRPFKRDEQVPDDEWRRRKGLTDDE